MDGILIIDKPAGMTSHDVVARVRRILNTKRVGHTGTLDPFATGVLVLLIGHATRFAQFVDKDEKEYDALLQFGFETDTGDKTGLRIADLGLRIEAVESRISSTDWEAVLEKFRGKIMQTPPMYSAKKIEGKKLYELARSGVDVERKAVQVSINRLELLPRRDDDSPATIRFRVACSAGTYVRTLAEEIGREIGVGGHLSELRRTRAGRFTLEDATSLEAFESLQSPETSLMPASEAVAHLPEIKLPAERVAKAQSGLSSRIPGPAEFPNGAAIRMLDESSSLIAIGIFNAEEKSVKPKIVLV